MKKEAQSLEESLEGRKKRNKRNCILMEKSFAALLTCRCKGRTLYRGSLEKLPGLELQDVPRHHHGVAAGGHKEPVRGQGSAWGGAQETCRGFSNLERERILKHYMKLY